MLQTTLRKKHPDGHWYNALEKYIKGFIREFDARLVSDLKELAELREKIEALLQEMARLPSASTAIDDAADHNDSEHKAEQLALQIGALAKQAYADRAIKPVAQRPAGAKKPRKKRKK